MTEKTRYYILFDNYTQGLFLKDLLTKSGIRSRIAPTPHAIQGELGCGVCLLVEPEEIDAAKACIEANRAEYHSIVPLAGQINPKRNRFC